VNCGATLAPQAAQIARSREAKPAAGATPKAWGSHRLWVVPAAALVMAGILVILVFSLSGCGSLGKTSAKSDATTTTMQAEEAGTLFPAMSGGKSGYINAKGKWVIQPQFAYAGRFSEGLAAVLPAGALHPNNLAALPGGYGYLNAKGKWVIQPRFSWALEFSEGLACVNQNTKYGYINAKGKWVIQPQFLFARSFSDGLAYAELNGKTGYINTKGNWVIQPGGGDFSEGLASAALNGKTGYINTKGKWVIQAHYENAGDFSEGLASAEQSGKWGYINTSGKWVIQPQFDAASPLSEGLAPAEQNGKWGYIDTKGSWVIQPQYPQAEEFDGGLALVISPENSRSGSLSTAYIDKTGKVIWSGVSRLGN
jgi:hypothetical protein